MDEAEEEMVYWTWRLGVWQMFSTIDIDYSQNRLEYEKRVKAQARAMAPQEWGTEISSR